MSSACASTSKCTDPSASSERQASHATAGIPAKPRTVLAAAKRQRAKAGPKKAGQDKAGQETAGQEAPKHRRHKPGHERAHACGCNVHITWKLTWGTLQAAAAVPDPVEQDPLIIVQIHLPNSPDLTKAQRIAAGRDHSSHAGKVCRKVSPSKREFVDYQLRLHGDSKTNTKIATGVLCRTGCEHL